MLNKFIKFAVASTLLLHSAGAPMMAESIETPAVYQVNPRDRVRTETFDLSVIGLTGLITVSRLVEPIYTLVPGTQGPGVWAAQPTPSPVGISPIATIASWNVVQNEDITAARYIGVCAHNSNGMHGVMFSVNNGPWRLVTTSAANPHTRNRYAVGNPNRLGCIEYAVRLNPSDFNTDRQVEVRAIAIPLAGIPRDCGSLLLNVNGGATLPALSAWCDSATGDDSTGAVGNINQPFATILRAAHAIQVANGTGKADGGNIFLKAGSYELGNYDFNYITVTLTRWLNIKPAAGVPYTSVIITGSHDGDGIRTHLVHLQNLTVNFASASSKLSSTGEGSGINETLWLDGVLINGVGQFTNGQGDWTNGFGVYSTDVEIKNTQNGTTAALNRNVLVHDIGQIGFAMYGLIVNSTLYNNAFNGQTQTDNVANSWHPDCLKDIPGASNTIVQDFTATVGINSQGLFAGYNSTQTDMALIRVVITVRNAWRCFSFAGPTTNLFVEDSIFTGLKRWENEGNAGDGSDGRFTATNIICKNSFPVDDRPQNHFFNGVGVTYV